MTQITFRSAVAKDAENLTEVFHAAYAPFLLTIPNMPNVTAGISDDIAKHTVWVALKDGEIVGGLVAHIAPKSLHIANLAVHPYAARQGIAPRLLRIAEDHAHTLGIQSLHLATHPKMPQNIRFYERQGWSVSAQSDRKIEMSKLI